MISLCYARQAAQVVCVTTDEFAPGYHAGRMVKPGLPGINMLIFCSSQMPGKPCSTQP